MKEAVRSDENFKPISEVFAESAHTLLLHNDAGDDMMICNEDYAFECICLHA
jgi:hypothetical protein